MSVLGGVVASRMGGAMAGVVNVDDMWVCPGQRLYNALFTMRRLATARMCMCVCMCMRSSVLSALFAVKGETYVGPRAVWKDS